MHLKKCMRLLHVLAAVMLLATIGGCSHQKTLSHDDLRSQMVEAVSYASEAELFVDFVRQRRATEHYAEEHPRFLREEIGDSLKQLSGARSDAHEEPTLRLIEAELTALSNELAAIGRSLGDDGALAAARGRITQMRQTLERAQAGL